MAFKGITFAGQNVTPKNDGGLYQAHYGDGILWGCSMAISGDDLVIQSGEFIACGRVCQVDGATNVDLSARVNTNGYIQVIMNYDLSQGEGSQWYTTFVESATTTFPALTQDDINDTGTLYQLQLAVVQISGGNLTSIVANTALLPTTLETRELNASGITGEYRPNIGFFVDGDPVGRIQSISGSDDFRLFGYTSGGSIAGGIGFEPNGDDIVFGNGNGMILFRPKGIFDNSNQVAIDQNGQIVGGITYSSNYSANTVSCPANANTLLAQKTGLYQYGYYMAFAQCAVTPSSNVGTQMRIQISGDNGLSYTNSVYTFQADSFFLAVSGLFYNTQQISLHLRPYSNGVSGTASVRRLDIIRVG